MIKRVILFQVFVIFAVLFDTPQGFAQEAKVVDPKIQICQVSTDHFYSCQSVATIVSFVDKRIYACIATVKAKYKMSSGTYVIDVNPNNGALASCVETADNTASSTPIYAVKTNLPTPIAPSMDGNVSVFFIAGTTVKDTRLCIVPFDVTAEAFCATMAVTIKP
ncbi:hypothetical protein LB523_25855 [Mesorhizobium sp. ESP-6-4]|uniref:hypothetical protein n=1 Tax=unclassified Mesorhizobium TaxID=325217 RepID=UPI001140CBBA|nr:MULTISPECIES: hypothetical protein [unclassified Mesorhizobium]MBZ9662480.1 hypothetical protein [Mesorhizobium sp. ESP-6-4]